MVASRRVAIAIALVLLAATAAAFVYTERKKLSKGPISKPSVTRYFSPVCECDSDQAEVGFRLAGPKTVTVRIIRENGTNVRTLAERERFGKGVVELTWDGRTDDGEQAPDGRYRVVVRLAGSDTLVFPQRIVLDTVAPEAQLRRVAPSLVSLGEPVIATYRLSEAGSAILLVDGTEAETAPRRRRGKIEWTGSEPGTYALAIAARDLAGNVGEPSAPQSVVIQP